MSSRFDSAVLGSSLVYPNAVVWSDENLVAVACSNNVIILNPAKPSRPRGVINVPSSEPFPVGMIDGKEAEAQSGCLLPFELSRDTRSVARSISWSPVGLANNAGCLLAVCSTGGRVKLYRFPFCECLTEWIEVMDISEMLYKYFKDGDFGESQTIHSENVIPGQDKAEYESANDLSYSNILKPCKRRKINKVTANEPDNLRENTTWQMVPASEPKRKHLKRVNKDTDLSLITAQQYASRTAMLTSLVVAWSPILDTSRNGVGVPHNSSCCSILAIGGKCGGISLWRIHAPESYSIINTRFSGKVSLVGLLRAHDTWITAISWALYEYDVATPYFLLATGSSNGRVKLWLLNTEELFKSSEVSNSFTLLEEVTTADSATVTVLAFTVPSTSPWKLLLAIGKGSGSFEIHIIDMRVRVFEKAGCYIAHDHIITGLAWAFDGCCLYSCSQDNTMKSWIFVGNSLCEVPLPSKTPGLKSSFDVTNVSDSCYGLAVSPRNLAIAVARRFDFYQLDPMYEARTHKGAVEFLWIGGQQLDVSPNICSNTASQAFPGFPEKELNWWESNILWSLNQLEDISKILNIWDIVAALMAFKNCVTKYVDHVVLKWLTSYFGSQFDISAKFLSEASKHMAKLSSRQLHLINIICRHIVLKECAVDDMSRKHEGLNEEHVKFWTELLFISENELRERLVGFNFSALLSLLSDSSSDLCDVSCCSDGLAQMEQWASLNEKNIKDHSKFLRAEVGKFENRKQEIFGYSVDEQCSICSENVLFESAEYAVCSGGNCPKLQRCMVTMRIIPFTGSWFCISCQKRTLKLAPVTLFTLPGFPPECRSFIESCSANKESLIPCCPLCGILLGRSQPDYFLSPSPV